MDKEEGEEEEKIINPCKQCNNHIELPEKYHGPVYGLVCDNCIEKYGKYFVVMGHVDYEGDDALGVYTSLQIAVYNLNNLFINENDYYWEWKDIQVFNSDGLSIGSIRVD